jgi:hypothetical protein
MDEVVFEAAPSIVQASEFGLFRRRKRYHPPINMMSRPRTPNIEPSAMATMDLDLGSEDEVALAVEEAIMGTGKLEVEVGKWEEVGNWEEDVEELIFDTVV